VSCLYSFAEIAYDSRYSFIRRRRTEHLNAVKRLFMSGHDRRADRFYRIRRHGVDETKYSSSNSFRQYDAGNERHRLPGMDQKTVSPDSVRILMTGYADLHSAIESINRGRGLSFRNKAVE